MKVKDKDKLLVAALVASGIMAALYQTAGYRAKQCDKLWEKGYVKYPTDPKVIEMSKGCMK